MRGQPPAAQQSGGRGDPIVPARPERGAKRRRGADQSILTQLMGKVFLQFGRPEDTDNRQEFKNQMVDNYQEEIGIRHETIYH